MGFPNLFREPLLHILLEEATRIDLWGSPLLTFLFALLELGHPMELFINACIIVLYQWHIITMLAILDLRNNLVLECYQSVRLV